MRLISAHCSTPTPRLLLARADAQARVRTRPDTPDPAPGGSLFDRRRRVSIQAAPTGGASSTATRRSRSVLGEQVGEVDGEAEEPNPPEPACPGRLSAPPRPRRGRRGLSGAG